MSLNSTRGRFSKNNISDMKRDGSFISSFGVRPFFYEDDKNDQAKKEKKIDYKKRQKLYEEKEKEKQKIRDEEKKLKSIKNFEFEDIRFRRSKTSIGLIVAMVLIEILTLFFVISYGLVVRLSNTQQDVPFDEDNVRNKNIPIEKLEILKGSITTAVFGVDSRTGSVNQGTNADVIIIVNYDREKNEVQLVSIYRDTFVRISDTGSYAKINSAYSTGGPQRAVKTINENFDLNIQDYFTFNWKAVVESIDLLGGVDIEVTNAELKDLNPYIWDTGLNLGMTKEEVFQHLLINTGMQHLDGLQATAYSRLRHMDNDLKRTDRQRRVIMECVEKAKQMDFDTLRKIADKVLPLTSFKFKLEDLWLYISNIKNIKITAMTGFPETSDLIMQDMGKFGNCIVPNTLTTTVKKIHKLLYNEENYEPTNAVKSYSNRLIELRKQYKEEAEKAKEELESSETDNSIETTKKRASTNKSTNSTANRTLIVDDDNNYDYEDEPEEDENIPIIDDKPKKINSYENPGRAVSDNQGMGPGEQIDSVNIKGPMDTSFDSNIVSPGSSETQDNNLPIAETDKIPTPVPEMPTLSPVETMGDVSIVTPPMGIVVDIPY